MIQSFSRFSFPSHVSLCAQLILCLAATTGCSLGPSDADGSPDDSEDLAVSEEALGTGPWSSDFELNFIAKNGLTAQRFLNNCVSKKEGAPTITTAPLPVGGGRRIECQTDLVIGKSRTAAPVMSTTDVRWCAAGTFDRVIKPLGDNRTVMKVIAPTDGRAVTLLVTRDGDEVLISKAALPFSGQLVLPFSLLNHYRTTAMKKSFPATKPCEEQMR